MRQHACSNWADNVSLTHWGRVTHICVSKQTIIGSDNGLSPGLLQAIIWTNAAILLIGPLGTKFNEILIEIQTFSFKKMHLKMSSGKWRPFCLGLNVLKCASVDKTDNNSLPSQQNLFIIATTKQNPSKYSAEISINELCGITASAFDSFCLWFQCVTTSHNVAIVVPWHQSMMLNRSCFALFLFESTHCDLVMSHDITKLGQYWFR